MNKDLIKKYKAEFDHWMDGGKLQAYYKIDDDPKWWTDEESINHGGDDNFSNILQISLDANDVLIVIDDLFVEFRKALAEGKIVEFKHPRCDEWEIVTPEHSFQFYNTYRIKL